MFRCFTVRLVYVSPLSVPEEDDLPTANRSNIGPSYGYELMGMKKPKKTFKHNAVDFITGNYRHLEYPWSILHTTTGRSMPPTYGGRTEH